MLNIEMTGECEWESDDTGGLESTFIAGQADIISVACIERPVARLFEIDENTGVVHTYDNDIRLTTNLRTFLRRMEGSIRIEFIAWSEECRWGKEIEIHRVDFDHEGDAMLFAMTFGTETWIKQA